ncbi:MAG: hypothetical protein HZB38_00755 [Planctomycetes bacterium]|nr:hypothetical protein [Planctomycetota bacterium]
MVGTPVAVVQSLAAFRTAPDRSFAVAALWISVLEAVGILALLAFRYARWTWFL